MRASLVLALALGFFSSCASYTSATRKALSAFEVGDFTTAESVYSLGAQKEGLDQLVYLFERGVVRHSAGNYEGSIQDFLLAERLSEIKDYTALGSEAASVLVNDGVLAYKGEEFEHVLISVYLALNFAALGKDEEAAVAARQVNRKLERLRDEGKRDYDLNAFAQYLAGMLHERMGNWNFAAVDYKKTFSLAPQFSPLRADLVRSALKVDSARDIDRWQKTLGISREEVREQSRGLSQTGAVALLFSNGFAPEKVPSPHWHEVPVYRSRYSRFRGAHFFLNGEFAGKTELLFDVDAAAKRNLEQKYAAMIAKRLGGVVVRETMAHKMNQRNEGLGTVVALAMAAASQADLRAWLTLPQSFQVARAQRKPGRYKVSIRLEDYLGQLGDEIHLGETEIVRGGVSLVQYRARNR
jgi:uncharacterized protein